MAALTRKRIFLSATTADFDDTRRFLAERLGSTAYAVDWQGSLSQGGGTTLAKLEDIVRQSDAVVHLVGPECGSCPPPAAVADLLAEKRLATFATHFPGVLSRADAENLTLTQWEAFLAIFHGKPCFLFRRSDLPEFELEAAPPDPATPRQRQHQHWQRIKTLGKDRGAFEDEKDLAIEIFRALLDGRILPGDAPAPTGELPWPTPDPGFRQLLPTVLADREECFGLYERMLIGQGEGKRALLIRAESGLSKTSLVRAMHRYARHLRVPSCCLDLTGTKLETALGELVASLESQRREDPLLPAGVGRSLRALNRPALLAFDTYEAADASVRAWIEDEILSELDACPGLIVVIAGQRVPEARAVDRWKPWSSVVELTPIANPAPWETYYRAQGCPLPDRHLEFLRIAVELCRGVPTDIEKAVGHVLRSRAAGGAN